MVLRKSWSKRNLWEAIPASGRQVLGRVLGRLPLNQLLGRRFRETRAFLHHSERWDRKQIESYQLERLREVLEIAEAKSPYYKNIFRMTGFRVTGFKRLSDLNTLPTMSKQEVVTHLEEMMTCPPTSAGIDYVSTGGSSGAPLAFYAPASRSAVEYAYLTRGWERSGYRLGDAMAVLRGRVVGKSMGGIRYEHDPLLRQHFYSNFHLNSETAADYLRHIENLGPCVLHAYASSASALAGVILHDPKLKPQNVKAVLLESENVFPDQVERIRSAFGVLPFSSYGHSEKLVLATACEANNRYHVWPTYGYFELLDENGRAVTEPGQRGEIVGTGFINTVVPMIRYRTGDFATYHGERCTDCGRNHPVLERIEGRWPQGNLVAADGSVISMTTLNMHDDCMAHVAEYQFVQDDSGRADMLVKPDGVWPEGERERIEVMVNRRLQKQVRITVRTVGEVHRTPAGKLLRVLSSKQIEDFGR